MVPGFFLAAMGMLQPSGEPKALHYIMAACISTNLNQLAAGMVMLVSVGSKADLVFTCMASYVELPSCQWGLIKTMRY